METGDDDGENAASVAETSRPLSAEPTHRDAIGTEVSDELLSTLPEHAYAAPEIEHKRTNASPKARRLAKQNAIDLQGLVGSGIDGMIRVVDVERAMSDAESAAGSATSEISRLQLVVAERTSASKRSVPHFYLMADVNMAPCRRLREKCQAELGWPKPPTYTALLLKACAAALSKHSFANRSWVAGKRVQRKGIHIGVATDTDNGLLVPVIRDVDRKSLRELSDALAQSSLRARHQRLSMGDVGEKSMVISNLGMYPVDQFIAIIDMPDPMILAVGRIADRVVAIDGKIAILPMCTLTLSVDHRVLDGVQGAKFLAFVKEYLEESVEDLSK